MNKRRAQSTNPHAQVPGLQLHPREGASAAYRAAGAGPVPERVRELTRRTRGMNLPQILEELSRLPDRLARLLRLLRDPVGLARSRPVDPATATCRRLEAVETRNHPVASCDAAASAGTWRRKPRAARTALGGSAQPGAKHRPLNAVLASLGLASLGPKGRLIRRTAVYGPVCTVVWEGEAARPTPIPIGPLSLAHGNRSEGDW